MLKRLTVENLGHARSVVVEFAPQLNILTGESGAGKSFLIKALELLFDRLPVRESPSVRGASKALIRAEFELSDVPEELRPFLADLGLNITDTNGPAGPLVVASGAPVKSLFLAVERTLEHNKRTRTKLNGAPIATKDSRMLFDLLFDLHRQHDHLWLKDAANYLTLLECFDTTIATAQQSYKQRYASVRDDILRLKDLARLQKDAAARKAYLDHVVADITPSLEDSLRTQELEAKLGELKSRAERSRLLAIIYSGEPSAQTAPGGPSIGERLQIAQEGVKELLVNSAADSKLERAAGALSEAISSFDEVKELLGPVSEGELDERQFDQLSDKISKVRHLEQRYGCPPGTLGEKVSEIEKELEELDSLGSSLREAYEKVSTGLTALYELGLGLCKARVDGAEKINEQLAGVLEELGLHGTLVRFVVEPLAFLSTLSEDQADPPALLLENFGVLGQGLESVEIVMSGPGERPGPLRHRASGGELSRIMLAIRTVLSAESSQKTCIFDEVDQGVSGAIAARVGEHLHAVADQRQTIVVSHLPQVVCQADRAIGVEKHADIEGFSMSARILNGDDLEMEVARLISGRQLTEDSIIQAKQLLNERRDHPKSAGPNV